MAKKLVSYDASVIDEFASRLYSQAASIIATSTIVSLVIGSAVGLVVVVAMKSQNSIDTAVIIGALAGGIIGFMRGRERAFKLKLDAQIALCQVQIERNTRAGKV
jgi:VIT1/CCC1 family predicted Fe2+/Mn2+ transporter